MKKRNTTPTNLILKMLDMQLKAMLEADLKAFRTKQLRSRKVAA